MAIWLLRIIVAWIQIPARSLTWCRNSPICRLSLALVLLGLIVSTVIFVVGTVVVDGFEGKAPSYYDKLLKRREALCFEDVKIDREFKAYPQREHGLPDRLRDRLTVSLAKTSIEKG